MRKLKIAMVSIHSDPLGKLGTTNTGGMSVYIRELASELGKAGHEIDIYTRSKGGPKGDSSGNHRQEFHIADNIRFIHISSGHDGHIPKERLHGYIPDLFRSMEKYREENGRHYDLIHSHYWLSGLLGKKARTEWNVPHVTTFHTMGMAKRVKCAWEQEPILRIISERRLTSECNRVLALTRQDRDFLVKYYRVPSEKIGIVPCGVNLKQFDLIHKGDARRRIGLDQKEFIILFVGRFVPIKGIDRLIASVSHLGQRKNLRLVIVGGDGDKSSNTAALKRLVHKSGIDRIVRFAGRIEHSDLFLYYNASDVLVIPSYYESFGLVALESLACGTPVIAPRVGAMESMIRSGLTGLVLDRITPRSLALAIERFRSSRNDMLTREEIRSSVLNFTWSNTAERTMREYIKVIESPAVNTERGCLVS